VDVWILRLVITRKGQHSLFEPVCSESPDTLQPLVVIVSSVS